MVARAVFMWIRIAICDAIWAQLRIKRQIDSQLCESKMNESIPSKKVNSHEFRRKRRLT